MDSKNDNTFNRARRIGVLDDTEIIRGSVSRRDRVDFLAFKVPNRTEVQAVLQGLSRNADLVLFDGDRNRLAVSKNPGQQSELINTVLERGNYFMKVIGTGRTNYRLRLSTGPNPATAKFVGLTDDNRLAFFNDTNLSRVRQVRLRGLQAGETLVGIDFRPNTGQLFGVGSRNRLYVINPTTGRATQVGDPFAVPLNGTSFGVDFNPTVDRIRVVSDAGQNLRLNPDTGAVVDADTLMGGIQIDGNLNGDTDSIVATAYTNNFSGTTTTVQYGIDADTDQLYIQNPPNDGTQTVVGSLGVDFDADAGLDIVTENGVNRAFATSGSSLYSIDLTTGAATLVGDVRNRRDSLNLVGFAARSPIVKPDPNTAKFVGLTTDSDLVFFNSNALNNVTKVDITGLQAGETLVGIDIRPNNGQLFGVGSRNRLYRIDTATGRATAVGDRFAASLNGMNFGVDFNPTVDRIRVVSDAGQNLRLNPDTGAVVDADTLTGGLQIDGNLNGATDAIVATAYTNNVSGATTTTQYGINADTDQLFIQNPPNDGTQTLVGALGVDVDANAGFDIVTSNGMNMGFVSSGSSLYSIDLNSGAATLIGTVQNVTQPIALAGLAARA
jgi:3D (Asp-Asp-Asp) domain-containing protein